MGGVDAEDADFAPVSFEAGTEFVGDAFALAGRQDHGRALHETLRVRMVRPALRRVRRRVVHVPWDMLAMVTRPMPPRITRKPRAIRMDDNVQPRCHAEILHVKAITVNPRIRIRGFTQQ